jgi:hypothetical protein
MFAWLKRLFARRRKHETDVHAHEHHEVGIRFVYGPHDIMQTCNHIFKGWKR